MNLACTRGMTLSRIHCISSLKSIGIVDVEARAHVDLDARKIEEFGNFETAISQQPHNGWIFTEQRPNCTAKRPLSLYMAKKVNETIL